MNIESITNLSSATPPVASAPSARFTERSALGGKVKKILFIHPNFPGQFRYLAEYCAASPWFEVDFITEALPCGAPGIRMHRIVDNRSPRSESTAKVLRALKAAGYIPDLAVAHSGWGHDYYFRDIFPETSIISYPEWYHHEGDIRNEMLNVTLQNSDHVMVPTQYQKSRFPTRFHDKIRVIHEGVDVQYFSPATDVVFKYFEHEFKCGDEIITYAARGLEPVRGFPEFMRAIPSILNARPNVRVIIAGDQQSCYGPAHPSGMSWRKVLEDELKLPLERVIFCGKVGEPYLLKIFQISSLHIYLSRPFILSWSILEAMSSGCLILGNSGYPLQEVLTDGYNGVVCELDNISIAETAIRILESPGKFQHCRVQAREFAKKNYCSEKCVQNQLQLF
ncbi:MAG: glycosyltransferase [Victivallaceae bacterium]|jgi:glycosyltransferase involved in cell wall biosynthesis|nr:glycosyltransferase [Victivallaceae bacterium]MDD3702913.1 glycosyltransferase [Victivallaceae bacterium]MDD4317265.1 glycosyltransferase [Victivallaceae bacterium]MDD5662866.1 glycosyltransferase [Victivallaceae bacterium]NLK84105.1 glycosyltransferase [Lentisphaerota bacterium]